MLGFKIFIGLNQFNFHFPFSPVFITIICRDNEINENETDLKILN